MAAAQTGNTYISACTLDRNAFPLANNVLIAWRTIANVVPKLAFVIIVTESYNLAANISELTRTSPDVLVGLQSETEHTPISRPRVNF